MECVWGVGILFFSFFLFFSIITFVFGIRIIFLIIFQKCTSLNFHVLLWGGRGCELSKKNPARGYAKVMHFAWTVLLDIPVFLFDFLLHIFADIRGSYGWTQRVRGRRKLGRTGKNIKICYILSSASAIPAFLVFDAHNTFNSKLKEKQNRRFSKLRITISSISGKLMELELYFHQTN